MLLIEDILQALSSMGITRGNAVLVSSDIRMFVPTVWEEEEKSGKAISAVPHVLDMLIDGLQDLVGVNGTLLFPTYNWDFCKGKSWDYDKTLGKTGALSNHALGRKDFKRTRHPIYSFAVWGKDADLLVTMRNHDSFSEDSPFGYLYHTAGKNIAIGVEGAFFTFGHYVEQCNNVTYRYIKNFVADYIIDGHTQKETYSMFVRQLDPEVISVSADEILLKEGAMLKKDINGILITSIDLVKAYKTLENDIQKNNARHLMRYKNS